MEYQQKLSKYDCSLRKKQTTTKKKQQVKQYLES